MREGTDTAVRASAAAFAPRRSWVSRAGGGVVAVGLSGALITGSPLHGRQYSRPRPSPHETVSSVVDGAHIDIIYGRPSMRGRRIFGALVPYGHVWMPGADEATIIRTTAALQFGRFRLPAGAYSLYTLPSEKGWTLIINRMTGQFHTYYPEADDLVKLPMTLERLSTPVEQLTITAVPRAPGGALQLEWEETRAFVPFAVPR